MYSPIVSFIVLSTFLPVFLLVVASFGTSFMSVNSIVERIAVSSVVLQSVLTLYIQVSSAHTCMNQMIALFWNTYRQIDLLLHEGTVKNSE